MLFKFAIDDVHHALAERVLQTQNSLQRSLRSVQLSRGSQRQDTWKGMPVVFVHGPHKNTRGYIKSAQEIYPPASDGPALRQTDAHVCIARCGGCNQKSLTAEHICTFACPGCKKARDDASQLMASLNDFVDIALQVDIHGAAPIQASVREVRPSE